MLLHHLSPDQAIQAAHEIVIIQITNENKQFHNEVLALDLSFV